MKIGIIVRKLNVRGGTQRQALHLARELLEKGHAVTLYTFLFSPRDCYPELLGGMPVVALGRYPAPGIFSFREYEAAQELAQLIDPACDLLNPHDQVSYRVAVYFKKRVKHIPSVWMMNDLPTRMFSLFRQEELDAHFRAGMLRKGIARILDWYEAKRFFRMQDIITVLDARDRRWLREQFDCDARVVRSGVDSAQYGYAQKSGQAKKTVQLLMAGILFPHRRFEDGIRALAIVRKKGHNAWLTIVGDFTSQKAYHSVLLEVSRQEGVFDFVQFKGKVSDGEMKEAYRSHDIFLFPNHLQSWGLAVFEAMASGCPVIVSNTAGASEVLTDGENALLVPPKSPETIASAIRRLIADPALYQSLSVKGRAFVEAHISWQNYAKGMLEVFEEARAKYKER